METYFEETKRDSKGNEGPSKISLVNLDRAEANRMFLGAFSAAGEYTFTRCPEEICPQYFQPCDQDQLTEEQQDILRKTLGPSFVLNGKNTHQLRELATTLMQEAERQGKKMLARSLEEDETDLSKKRYNE